MANSGRIWNVVGIGTLQEIQNRFSEVTGLAAIIADSSGKGLTQASHFSDLCRRIRKSPLGRQRCFDCDNALGRQAADTRKPCMHYCHSGLLDVAAPIVVNNEYVGSVLCGQVLFEPPGAEKRREIAARVADLGITPQEVDRGLESVTVMSEDRLQAAANLLHVLANSIVSLVVSLQVQHRLSEETRARMELEKSLKDMELRVLQSQVNPHFLFNTLNTLARMALFESATKTEELAYRMTRILRFTLSRMDQLILLKEELVRVEDYLHLQRARFGQRIRFFFDVNPAVEDVRIPILTVQPLVENAVVRGLEPLADGGEVHISACAEGNDAIIDVEDTGVGLDPSVGNGLLLRTLPPSGTGHTTGLGIPNVHQRLQHYFGSRYGLTFLPVAQGTRVRIRVPRAGVAGGVEVGTEAAHR